MLNFAFGEIYNQLLLASQ